MEPLGTFCELRDLYNVVTSSSSLYARQLSYLADL